MLIKLQVTSIYTQTSIQYLLMWNSNDPEFHISKKLQSQSSSWNDLTP